VTTTDVLVHLSRSVPASRRQGYVEHYNNVRLNNVVGYITPKDMLHGHQAEIHAEKDRKLEMQRPQATGVRS
jgi:hypothetical protein